MNVCLTERKLMYISLRAQYCKFTLFVIYLSYIIMDKILVRIQPWRGNQHEPIIKQRKKQ